ncbi:uncharacterized protein MONOS_6034 [Monocercomonoides exilis]|uniref:uncharacterized protein n=1 Tax=Monocercomonoides exilis TaxID=2049356 RepID=UPI00355AAA90|nr:hypothetical protein MONOS_6034 [Monocercomonoides exilis]
MIEEKKLQLGNATSMLKHIGYCNVLKNMSVDGFKNSSMEERIKKMIIDENGKKDAKDEKLLVDNCECYLSLSNGFSSELISMCVRCLLKVALKKEESEETQKEVETALLSLRAVRFYFLEQEQ